MKIKDDLSHAESIVLGGRRTRRLTPEERECVRRIRERALHERCAERATTQQRRPLPYRRLGGPIDIPALSGWWGRCALIAVLLLALTLML